MVYDTEAIADHKTVCTTVDIPNRPPSAEVFRLQKHDELTMPMNCSLTDWREACCAFLSDNPIPQSPESVSQNSIDEYWAQVNKLFDAMMLHARNQFNDSARPSAHHAKGDIKLLKGLPQLGKLDHATDTMLIRRLRNLLAKLREFQKLQNQDFSNSMEFRCLKHKIGSNPLYNASLSVTQNIHCVRSWLDQERASHQQSRISKWKQRLQESYQSCFRWLKKPVTRPFNGLISSRLNVDVATDNFSQSLKLIRDHWRLVWRRQHGDHTQTLNRMRVELGRQRIIANNAGWTHLSPADLAEKATTFKGKADGWSGDEISSLLLAAFEIFAEFCQTCETSGFIPKSWQIARQTHLPKGQKGLRTNDGARDVIGLTPPDTF